MKQLAIRLGWQKTPAKSLVMSERAARVPQPPDQSSNAGHRIIDGREAVLFLSTIKEALEFPGRVLLDL